MFAARMALRNEFERLMVERQGIHDEAKTVGFLWPPLSVLWPESEAAQRVLCERLQTGNQRIYQALQEFIAEFGSA